jgi:MFS family permease
MNLWSPFVSLKAVIFIFAFWSIGLMLFPLLGGVLSRLGFDPFVWWLPFFLSLGMSVLALGFDPALNYMARLSGLFQLFVGLVMYALLALIFLYPVVTYYLYRRNKTAWKAAIAYSSLTVVLDVYLGFVFAYNLLFLPVLFNLFVMFLLWHCRSIIFKNKTSST